MGLLFVSLVLVQYLLCLGSVSLPPSFPRDASRILSLASNSSSGFDRLTLWVDSVGHRVSGSSALQAGLDLAKSWLVKEGFENVHFEAATIPKWERREESLDMIQPCKQRRGVLRHLFSAFSRPTKTQRNSPCSVWGHRLVDM